MRKTEIIMDKILVFVILVCVPQSIQSYFKETTSSNRRLIEVHPEYGRDYRVAGTIDIDNEPFPKALRVVKETTPRGEGVTDDIVFSGAGSGCAYDDEDDCTMAGSGDKDALVRPIVKIKTTPRPPTTTARPTMRTTTTLPGPRPIPGRVGSGEPPCGTDDEDCTGSGSGDYDRVDPVNTPKVVTDDILFTSEPTQKQPPDSGGGNPGWGDHRSSTRNPMVVTVNMTTIGPRRTTRVTTERTTNFPPKGDYEITPVPKHSKGKGFNLSSNIILIVGITAGVLVILLLLAFAIYKYKSRDEGSYKVDESKNYMHPYQEGAAIAACNKPSTQVNGGSCARAQSGMQTASKPKKNVKEWYV